MLKVDNNNELLTLLYISSVELPVRAATSQAHTETPLTGLRTHECSTVLMPGINKKNHYFTSRITEINKVKKFSFYHMIYKQK